MSVVLPIQRPNLGTSNILVGAPIGGDTWTIAGELCNWLNANGSVLVPWCAPITVVGAAETFRFYVQPTSTAIQRIWVLDIEVDGATTLTFKAPAATGTALTYAAPGPRRYLQTYRETLTAQSDALTEISIGITNTLTGGNDATVRGIYCVEQTRATLAQNTSDFGVDTNTTRPDEPMFFPSEGAGQSYGGVIHAIANLDARRVGILHWTAGDTPKQSATDIPLLTLPVPVLAQKLRRNDVTREVLWSAYTEMTAAATGTITVSTTNSGVSDSLSVNWTDPQWSAPRVIEIDCEDMATADGLQSASWDDMQIKIAGDGANSISAFSTSVWTPKVEPLYLGDPS